MFWTVVLVGLKIIALILVFCVFGQFIAREAVKSYEAEKKKNNVSLIGTNPKIQVVCPLETCSSHSAGKCTNDEVDLCTLINGYDHEGLYCRNYHYETVVDEKV